MTVALMGRNRIFVVAIAALVGLAAAMLMLWLGGGGPAAVAQSLLPAVQVTGEDSHGDHRPDLVETTTGRLIVAYTAHPRGDDERGLYIKNSDDGGTTWSDPVLIRYGNCCFWPDLAQGGDGTIWMAYHRRAEERRSNIYYVTSTDDGETWSEET